MEPVNLAEAAQRWNKFRRKVWDSERYFYIDKDNGFLRGDNGTYRVNSQMLLENDWEEYKE